MTVLEEIHDGLPPKKIGYESGKALMAHGPHALHEHVATKLELALGRALPQMEIRFENLSLAADIVVAEESAGAKAELPTISNAVKKAVSRFSVKKHTVRKDILKNVSGVFKPGTITLLLGQPGSGKSSLMKILSGRFPVAKNITVDGTVTYNGVAQHELTKRLPQFVAYVNQRDKHYPVLTVRETLEFAHEFCGGELSRRGEELLSQGTPEENAEAIAAANAMFEHYPEVILEQLGLQNCQDTVVGDAMLRGISGGERKRVTTGEMEFGMKYVTLMDEISTGLDSAAAFDIINTQRSVAKTLRKTVVIALLQPSPEIFALFDDVMILNDGQVMYHGPCDLVLDYFQQLGFVCPPERDVADYLLDLGTKQQRQYEVAVGGRDNKHPRTAREFAETFQRSLIHDEMLKALEAPHDPELLHNVGAHMDPMPEFHQSFFENTRTLMRRQAMVTMRNTAFLKGRTLMVVIIGLLYGSTFYQFDPLNIQVAVGVMFQAVLFLSLGQASQIPTFMAAREVFYKQRGANFLRTASYVLACSVSQVPLALAETLVFGSVVYWMCGFASNAAAYLTYLVVVFLTNLAFAAWFFFVAAIAPDLHIAKPLAMITVLFFVLFAGFIVAKSQMPDYFIWIYWINPIAWCLRAVAVNEYRSPAFDSCWFRDVYYCNTTDKTSMGEYYLGLYDIPSDRAWIWYGMVFMVACYVLFMAFGYATLEYKRYEAPEHVTLPKETADASARDGASDTDGSYTLATTPKDSSSPGSSSSPTRGGSNDVVLNIAPGLSAAAARAKHFAPVTLAFKDLWYTVPLPSNPKHETIDLLKGVSGVALPGTITALMGSSGAGKTTLMDVIAGRKTSGTIRGDILLNGFAATDLAIRRATGYCEQMDIHSEAATIREALTFSAFLRQDASVPDRNKFDSVTECIELLDLHDIAEQVIRGSSVEQMKRVTIGVELAAQPSVLFLDEPTSGLDARSAKMIMDGVRKVADTGRTVVCTIHQPSSEVFMLFDSLLLLKRGGETVFFGDLGKNCRHLVDYFERIPGVAPLPAGGYNPATWMLECIGAGVGHDTSAAAGSDGSSGNASSSADFVACFNESPQKRALDERLACAGVGYPSDASDGQQELTFARKRAATAYTQMALLVRRFVAMYWRTPSYNLTRLIISLVLALLFGLVFLDAEYSSYQGVNAGVGMIFLATLFLGMVSFNSVLPISVDERAAFYRERAAQTYNALWYFVGATLVEVPYVFASGAVFTAVFYPMVGFSGVGTAVLFWLHASLLILMQTYLGQLLAYAMPSVEVAAIIGVLVNSVFFLFMGFNPPASAIPQGYKWLYHATPQGYSLAILTALVFCDCDSTPTYDEHAGAYVNVTASAPLGCQPVRNTPLTIGHTTVKEYVESVFGMRHDDIGRNFGVVVACIVLFRVLALLALRFLNHQKR